MKMIKTKLKKEIQRKCKKIKLVITDVDGVLTDGGMYYSENGEKLKKFNTKDGMAVEILSNIGIKTIFLTKESSKIAKSRAKKVGALIFTGIKSKDKELPKICKKFKVKPNEITYLGDDINDEKIIKKVGFSASPSDGLNQIKRIVDYICKTKGGHGVLREVADMIIMQK